MPIAARSCRKNDGARIALSADTVRGAQRRKQKTLHARANRIFHNSKGRNRKFTVSFLSLCCFCGLRTFLTVWALPLGELSPQVTERALQPFSNDKINLCAHTAEIPVDIPVGKSQNLQPKRHQELRTFRIISKPLGFIMLRTIQFNDQPGRSAVKVHDESADNPLFVNFYWIFAEKKIP